MLDEPQFNRVDYRSECTPGGTLYVYAGYVHNAPMRETYHGFSTTAGCQLHDNTCFGGWWWPGCWWMPLASCSIDREEKQWSWATWRDGRYWELVEVTEQGCPCSGDYPCQF